MNANQFVANQISTILATSGIIHQEKKSQVMTLLAEQLQDYYFVTWDKQDLIRLLNQDGRFIDAIAENSDYGVISQTENLELQVIDIYPEFIQLVWDGLEYKGEVNSDTIDSVLEHILID